MVVDDQLEGAVLLSTGAGQGELKGCSSLFIAILIWTSMLGWLYIPVRGV